MPSKRAAIDRFNKKLAKLTSGCWLWLGNTTNGYGRFWVDGRLMQSHVWSYEYFVGEIPEGLELDHRCRTRSCANPTHLEPVTHQENLMRSDLTEAYKNAAKTHCPQDHPYDEYNTFLYRGSRYCRDCRKEYQRKKKKVRP